MKKTKMINSEISSVISKLGHTDSLVVGDSGLPIPSNVKRIDLAYTQGKPSFLEVLEAILNEQFVEKIILAKEIKENNKKIYEELKKLIDKFEEIQKNTINIEFVSHEVFKKKTKNSKAVVRTGEITPYANIILVSGVYF